MIFNNEIFSDIKIGDKIKVYVKKAREDGKFDFSLSPIGKKAKLTETEGTIIQLLKEADAQMPFTYKSDAEDIKDVFSMSKKAFKASLTKLISDEKILLEDDAIKVK
jgi:predicted RNA-binding protein (virulence factor B family)